MIAQLLLSALLCGVLVYAWVEYRRSPIVALLSVAASLTGLYFVWIPSHSTLVAEFVGIGRGVDLILYVWVCISLIMLLNLHLKLRTQHELITKLARTIAMTNVVRPPIDATLKDEIALHEGSPPVAGGGQMSRQMRDQIA
jgi:hypothetical protein